MRAYTQHTHKDYNINTKVMENTLNALNQIRNPFIIINGGTTVAIMKAIVTA